MQGLMQDWPLLVHKIIDHAALLSRRARGRDAHRSKGRSTAPPIDDIARARARWPRRWKRGVRPGDRVATLAWNTHAIWRPGTASWALGAVCHTLNPRLFPDQIAYIANHAEDQLLFFDMTFVPLVEKIAPSCRAVEACIVA